MSFHILTCPQRSPEWHAARCGKLTGSRVDEMLTQPRKGATESVTKRDLRIQLACELLTGIPQDEGYVNGDMRRGIEKEAAAIAAYEAASGLIVRRTGFLAHDSLRTGCSLDGHVGDFAGTVEVKCPKSATHLEYLRARTVPTEYMRQITHHLWMTGAAWSDFISFDDRFPLPLRLLRIRVTRESVDLAAYELALRAFLSEVEQEVASIHRLMEEAVAA